MVHWSRMNSIECDADCTVNKLSCCTAHQRVMQLQVDCCIVPRVPACERRNSLSYVRMSHAQNPLSHLLLPQPPDISGNGGLLRHAHAERTPWISGCVYQAESARLQHRKTLLRSAGSGSKNGRRLVDIIVTCSTADAFNHSAKSFICACDRSGASVVIGNTAGLIFSFAYRSPHLLNRCLFEVGSGWITTICPIERNKLLFAIRGIVRHRLLHVLA